VARWKVSLAGRYHLFVGFAGSRLRMLDLHADLETNRVYVAILEQGERHLNF